MQDLYQELKRYAEGGAYPFHMPGHKRTGAVSFGDPFAIDITEIDGFDNLHHPEGMLKEMQEEAAALYGACQTYFNVNGSTGGILSAICAATHYGDEILIARNCHKAVYNAIMLRGLQPTYLYPDRDARTGIAAAVSAAQVQDVLAVNPGIRVVVLVSPNYEGVTADIPAMAKVVHNAGAVLIVDEAHGAHLPFCRRHGCGGFPASAVGAGADLVIQSLHKTMPGLTQTALVHRCSERVPREKLEEALRIFQTSSPSYVLMASIGAAIRWGAESAGAFGKYERALVQFRQQMQALACLRLFAPEALGWTADPGKLVIYDVSGRMSGRDLYERLRTGYGLQPEMCTDRYVLLMTSPADWEEGFARLRQALSEIDRSLEESDHRAAAKPAILEPEQVWLPVQAANCETETVCLAESAGRIAGEYLYLYPPEIPLLVPGERVSQEFLDLLEEYERAGLCVRGSREHGKLQVTKEYA